MRKKTIDDLRGKGKRVIVRVDYNVPMQDGVITDVTKITATIPTLKKLLSQDASLILMSHLGRPKGKDKEFTLAPVAKCLEQLLERKVDFCNDCIGDTVIRKTKSLKKGDVALLENLRFYPGEEKNDPEFAKQLSAYGEIFVNDAFAASHRAHASIVGIPKIIHPAVAGYLVAKEIEHMGKLLKNPPRPFIAVIGGAKISTKIDVLKNLLPIVDRLLIGGGMAFTFFSALELEIGDSLVEKDALETARQIWIISEEMGGKMMLPVDFLAAKELEPDAAVKTVGYDQIQKGWRGVDIGQGTIQLYSEEIIGAKSVFLNGPMGIFEIERFSEGTRAIFEAMAVVSERGHSAIVGGGDSAAAASQLGFTEAMSHISTGGGASLEFMEGKELPGIAALDNKK